MTEFEIKAPLSLEDGAHKGVISKIEYRDDPYKYADIYIKPEGSEAEIKYGCPGGSVSENSKLGKLLAKFVELKVGDKIDPEKVLIGRKVVFMSIKEEAKDGRGYSRIVENSIKPVKEESAPAEQKVE